MLIAPGMCPPAYSPGSRTSTISPRSFLSNPDLNVARSIVLIWVLVRATSSLTERGYCCARAQPGDNRPTAISRTPVNDTGWFGMKGSSGQAPASRRHRRDFARVLGRPVAAPHDVQVGPQQEEVEAVDLP